MNNKKNKQWTAPNVKGDKGIIGFSLNNQFHESFANNDHYFFFFFFWAALLASSSLCTLSAAKAWVRREKR